MKLLNRHYHPDLLNLYFQMLWRDNYTHLNNGFFFLIPFETKTYKLYCMSIATYLLLKCSYLTEGSFTTTADHYKQTHNDINIKISPSSWNPYWLNCHVRLWYYNNKEVTVNNKHCFFPPRTSLPCFMNKTITTAVGQTVAQFPLLRIPSFELQPNLDRSLYLSHIGEVNKICFHSTFKWKH